MKFRSENVFIFLSVFFFESVFGTFTSVVKIRQGKLRGIRTISGQYRYFGIPYANSKRFQPPTPPTKWEGVFNAVNVLGSCSQTVSFLQGGSEDCLQLDVASPALPETNRLLPVLVWIHGGGYYYGSKWNYDPEHLVARDTVVVVVNYRLGVLGFLCIDGISNLGLKDQVAALKWIRKNIAAFGGDPDNVTVAGQSAGASAAAMHMLSKSSQGLFHKVILLSGTPLAPWAFNVEHEAAALEDATKIRKLTADETVLDVFSTATMQELLNATKDTSVNPRRFKYAPCVDSNFTAPFFHDTPYGAITSGNFNKVPIISGSTSAEGMLFYGLHDDKTLRELDEKFVEKLPAVFSWCSANKAMIAEKLRSHYFGGGINKAAVRGVVNFYSDWLAYATDDAFLSLVARYSEQPVYKYVFSYEGARNFAKGLVYRRRERGASHSDDIFYVFRPAGLPLPLAPRDKLFIDRLTAMLTDFMKFGDPTPATSSLSVRWPPLSNTSSAALVLDSHLRLQESHPRRSLFHNLLCQHGLQGYVPCDSQMKCSSENS